MSAFIHEMQHVYDYYYNRDLFMVSYDNVLEKYFFEMDAYHIEGLFINEVLKKEKISLSKFETLLSDSLKENNLDYFSIVFKGINMRQIYSYSGFVNKNNLKKTIKLYINDGKKIIENYKIEEKDDAWIKYQKIVPVFTYFYFIPQLTYDVVINKTDKKIKPTNFNLKKQYPELNEIWEKMRDIYNEEQDFFNNFGKEVNKNYNM